MPPSSTAALGTGVTAKGPGCAKTPVFNLLVESSSQFGESENKNAGDGYPMKAIEKLVLRFLGSHTFSHGLDPKLPFGLLLKPRLTTLLCYLHVVRHFVP